MNKSLMTSVIISLGVCASHSALAQDKSVTFVSQGGAYQRAQTQAILDPISKDLGITINQDSAPDALPMIKTQGMTGKVVWDVVDTPPFNCIRAGKQGLVQKLDFSRLPAAKNFGDDARTQYSVGYENYSSVIAYNKKKYGDNPPKTWADFWNVKKFPGRRALRNYPVATLEAALMADGVPRDELYPLDVDRAFAKLKEIKPHITTWWTSGGQSAQLLHDGEVDMIMMWNGRVSALMEDDPNIGFTYNNGIRQRTGLCILKGSPHTDTAYQFVNAAVSPQYQANLPKYIDYGPANPAAYDTGKISDQRAAELPSSPENAKKQAALSYEWWASQAGQQAQRRWLRFMQQ
ncbi:ABC transporter substrate-binding protein [Salinisphaera sp. SPP-AMP-43]|uniref:ABC transporter substrate-binding protein n=1 Tax=Salinisphaera sp. SPP-AMP-43 TaxID=3121288 RepID=UPI003C6E34C5